MIPHLVLTFLTSALLVEVLRLLPLGPLLGRFSRVSGRALHVLRVEGVSEHWKEKALMAYARRMFLATAGLALVLLAVLALVGAAIWLGEQVAGGFGAFLLSGWGLALSCAAAALWWGVRARVGP